MTRPTVCPKPNDFFTSHLQLILILAVAAAVRWHLALTGGQYFFSDEGRFNRGFEAYTALRAGDWAGFREAFHHADHAAFTAVSGVTVALQHQLAGLCTPWGDWATHPQYYTFSIGYAAGVLSMAAVIAAWLVYRIALATGASRSEALWACLLASFANTSVMYCRHLLSYDASLMLFLCALLTAASGHRAWRSVIAGVLIAFSYHVYNGYWFLTPLLAVFLVLRDGIGRAGCRQAALFSITAVATVIGGYAVGVLLYGPEFLRFAVAFSGTVTQGVFAEGWSFPWEFLTHSESYLGLAVLIVILLAVYRRKAGQREPWRVRVWGGLLLAAYLLLVIASCGFHRFVVYGRTVKPLIPLFSLAGGWAICALVSDRWPRRLGMLALTLLLAGWNLAPHFGRVFPREFEIAVMQAVGNPKRTLTVSGSIYVPLAQPVTAPQLVLVNAQYLYPIRNLESCPAGVVVARVPHPLSYVPLQYEGHSPAMRRLLRQGNIDMQLVRLDPTARVPDDLPIRRRFQPADRPDGIVGLR